MDPLTRLDRYKATHPDVTVTPPRDGNPFWEGHKDGQVIGSGYQLERLLDRLEVITWPITEVS